MHKTATLLVVTDYQSDVPATMQLTGHSFLLLQSPSKLQESVVDRSKPAIVVVDVRFHLPQVLAARQSLWDRKLAFPFLFVLDDGQTIGLHPSQVLTRPVTLHALSKRLEESLLLADSYLAYCRSREYHCRLQGLSDRERHIAQLASNGVSNRGMASHFDVSIKTVEKQRQRTYEKLGVYDLAQLTRVVTLGNLDPILPAQRLAKVRPNEGSGLSRKAG